MWKREVQLGCAAAETRAQTALLLAVSERLLCPPQALHYYTLSAQQSNAGSLLKLADYSYYGLGTDVDYEEAAGYYMQVSEGGEGRGDCAYLAAAGSGGGGSRLSLVQFGLVRFGFV